MTGVDSLFRYSCCTIALADFIQYGLREGCDVAIILRTVARAKSGAIPAGPNQVSHADADRTVTTDGTDAEPHHSHPLLLATIMTLSSSSHNQYELPPSNLPGLRFLSARLPDGSCLVDHR